MQRWIVDVFNRDGISGFDSLKTKNEDWEETLEVPDQFVRLITTEIASDPII